MENSKLRQLVKESIGSMLRSKMNLTAEDFLSLPDTTSNEAKLEAFKKAYSRGNTDSQTSLKTLLNQEPYTQLKSFVDMLDSAKSNKVSINVDPNRQFGIRSINEEQLRMQFLAGIITEAEYKEKLDEGIKDITAGVLIALSSLLGGKSIAQEIFPINDFQQPNRSELKIAQSLKQSLENESTYKRVDTLINTAADKIAGEDEDAKDAIGDFKQLIHTKYYKNGEWIGQVMQQKSRTDGVDQELFHNYYKPDGGEFINLDSKSIEDAVAASKTEVKELQNELDQFLENFKSDVAAGKVSGTELGLNYRGKIEQLENKIEKLQKKYPQLKFSGMDYSDYKYFKGKNSGDGRLIDILNSLENNKYGMEAKLSFEDYWGGDSDLGYNPK